MQSLSENKSLDLLSQLLIMPPEDLAAGTVAPELERAVLRISKSEFDALVALADTNHVIVRALDMFQKITHSAGDGERTGWAEEALSRTRPDR